MIWEFEGQQMAVTNHTTTQGVAYQDQYWEEKICPRGVVGQNCLSICWRVHDISRTFDFLTPLKFPLRPPLGGGVNLFR